VRIVDANVLLYAINRSSAQHARSRAWLDGALSDREPVGFAWPVLLAFLRLATHPAVFPRPLSTEDALAVARDWLTRPAATVVEPTARHLDVLAGILMASGTSGNRVSDAHLAALAVEHAATIMTFDTHFDRFEGVSWEAPT
jgi:toxin-antitoxin system PIN domain toxin